MGSEGAAGQRVLTVQAGGERLAVPAPIVREVARVPRLTRVPHAPKALLGLANIRGAVVPVLSLADLVERPAGTERRVVIVDDGALFGLAVDAVDTLAEDGESSARTLDLPALIAARLAPDGSRAVGRPAAEEAAAETAQHAVLPLVVFAIGSQEFALPLGAVENVLRLPDTIAEMPHADAVVVGSATVRGALLPLLSLRALLAMPAAAPTSRTRVVVAWIGAHRVGLVVDAIRGVERVPEAAIDAIPQVLTRGSAEARIQAICRLEEGRRLVSLLAAEHLLHEDITARLTQASTADEIEESAMDATSEQFLLFRIGESDFALPIAAVEEVAPLPRKLTRLPKAPGLVQGVMNLRGTVVPVIDQAERFGAATVAGGKRRVVVVRIGDLQAGFVVDSASEVLRIAADAVGPAPDLGGAETRVFERVANLPDQDRIVLIVSPRELLDRAEQDLLRGMAAAS
ncbi:purine-binding chemotaxis protein CheW [Sphingomonas sp. NFR04]|uniref:chemotaxis protein CheW n=1 Tax=Sphingomonas sp. NFR04 TaxID=1566283 RepID=UPI0008EB0531|nr:chemotaxis protein CheW [Sphingomonas sp. NFR04]SFJ09968.1 purine-binding chemotaxis protein CheW [Sphingomonas sp. NFR04]